MTLELASERVVPKPWGKTDLRPWSELGRDGAPIGELWFERADPSAPEPSLLLKLLFTDEALSIQVHPNDTFAQQIGLPHGKTEAWYIVSADPEAKLALGLKHKLTASQLRTAIRNGSLPDLVHWQQVQTGDAVLVAAGTIHGIWAGFVIAEIQQRSDATFRLFDYGRGRELHVDSAVRAATPGPALPQAIAERLNCARLVVACSPFFVFEQIELPSDSFWEIDASSETWILPLDGSVSFELFTVRPGQAVYAEKQQAPLRAGPSGAKALMAYVATEPHHARLVGRKAEHLDTIPVRVPELAVAASSGVGS